jgi:CO/xanthine dehydrogenase Mo-binding subunit
MSAVTTSWCGQSVERVEDAVLLTGRGRFIDDLGVKPGMLHAAILRSPYGHARIMAIRAEAARNAPSVAAVLIGKDITALSASLVVKAPIECWPIAVDRVRYGEPVPVVVAASRQEASQRHGRLDAVDRDGAGRTLLQPAAAIRRFQRRLEAFHGKRPAKFKGTVN